MNNYRPATPDSPLPNYPYIVIPLSPNPSDPINPIAYSKPSLEREGQAGEWYDRKPSSDPNDKPKEFEVGPRNVGDYSISLTNRGVEINNRETGSGAIVDVHRNEGGDPTIRVTFPIGDRRP